MRRRGRVSPDFVTGSTLVVDGGYAIRRILVRPSHREFSEETSPSADSWRRSRLGDDKGSGTRGLFGAFTVNVGD